MKAYWGSGGTAPRTALVRPQSRSGRGGEEKISQPQPGIEVLIIKPAAQRYATELSRLLACAPWNQFTVIGVRDTVLKLCFHPEYKT
jgi:hypothetical protein